MPPAILQLPKRRFLCRRNDSCCPGPTIFGPVAQQSGVSDVTKYICTPVAEQKFEPHKRMLELSNSS
jgi:hypothetical protein